MTSLDVLLVRPLSDYALEQLRRRFLHSVTTTRDVATGASVAVQMAHGTEVRAVLAKLGAPAPGLLTTLIPSRRRFLDVDADLQATRFLLEPALDGLTPAVPLGYVSLFRRHLASDYPRYRVCAVAALLCAAAAA